MQWYFNLSRNAFVGCIFNLRLCRKDVIFVMLLWSFCVYAATIKYVYILIHLYYQIYYIESEVVHICGLRFYLAAVPQRRHLLWSFCGYAATIKCIRHKFRRWDVLYLNITTLPPCYHRSCLPSSPFSQNSPSIFPWPLPGIFLVDLWNLETVASIFSSLWREI